MARVLVYFAHPGRRFSHVNAKMVEAASRVEDISFVDLYAEYPRHNIEIDVEQKRLSEHDIILFQFPLFWYSTPSLLKEWMDLVLEHGFAYGTGGDQLMGKTLMCAISAAGPQEAYTSEGYQRFSLRTFLSPLDQTAHLCRMKFAAPYVLHGALHASEDGRADLHAQGYVRLLEALRDNDYDLEVACGRETVSYDSLPILDRSTEGEG